MIVTAWNNGSHGISGAGYGLKVSKSDRDRYFRRQWNSVILELEETPIPIEVNIDKESFWGETCRELIGQGIGIWLRKYQLAPYPKGRLPKLVVEPISENWFRVKLPSTGVDRVILVDENAPVKTSRWQKFLDDLTPDPEGLRQMEQLQKEISKFNRLIKPSNKRKR